MFIAVVLLPALQRNGSGLVDRGAQFGDLAVEMHYVLRPCPLVQVIDVLGDDLRVRKDLLELSDRYMRSIRLRCKGITTTVVIELDA